MFLSHHRTKTHTWTKPSMRSRKQSWSSASSFASCRATNCSRNWPSSRRPSRPCPRTRAQSPAVRSKTNALSSRQPLVLTPLSRPTARQPRILRSPRRAKTGGMPTCEMSWWLSCHWRFAGSKNLVVNAPTKWQPWKNMLLSLTLLAEIKYLVSYFPMQNTNE